MANTLKRIFECIGVSLLVTFSIVAVVSIIIIIGYMVFLGLSEEPVITGILVSVFAAVLAACLWEEFS